MPATHSRPVNSSSQSHSVRDALLSAMSRLIMSTAFAVARSAYPIEMVLTYVEMRVSRTDMICVENSDLVLVFGRKGLFLRRKLQILVQKAKSFRTFASVATRPSHCIAT